MSQQSSDVKPQTGIKAGKSGMTNKEYLSGPLGGVPPKKDREAISNANSPSAREKAPGSVRQ